MSAQERVRLELGVVTTIELNSPPLNLVDIAMTEQLDAALDRILTRDDVRSVVLGAVGDRAFCAGSDIGEFSQLAGRVAQHKLLLEKYVYRKLARLPTPTIAAVEGDALGGGLELALCCDLRVASTRARLGLPESRLAVLPGSGGTQRLPALVGPARAKQIMFLGETLTAEEAERIGLVNVVVEAGSARPAAAEMATRIAQRGPIAVRRIKSLVDAASDIAMDAGLATELDASERVFNSDDMTEGVHAFFDHRPPSFTGR